MVGCLFNPTKQPISNNKKYQQISTMDEGELDPRIQVELESLNTSTDEINKLEIELEEANSTFRILLNESTRRLKLLSKKLGSCIEKSRPYHEAVEKSRLAQIECQAAAVKFQRANEIYAAAKETVALAEQRFMSSSHEWQFDNAWQEMLNHATIKVMDAEKQKTDCNADHHRKADLFSAAELKVSEIEDRSRRNIAKSRPYFDEKQICQDQLQTQKERIQYLQTQVQRAKRAYSQSLKNLEQISEDIHKMRGDLSKAAPSGPREPGVGAELSNIPEATRPRLGSITLHPSTLHPVHPATVPLPFVLCHSAVPDIAAELSRCDINSVATSSAVSEKGDDSEHEMENERASVERELDLEELRKRVKVLAVRPVEGGDGQQTQDVWESELNDTVNKLDRLMMIREGELTSSQQLQQLGSASAVPASLPVTPLKSASALPGPVKSLLKAEPLPTVNVSMRELPLLSRLSNEIAERTLRFQTTRRRSLE